MEKKGSITVFLALILSLLLSLVATSIQSVQAAAARTQILNSMDIVWQQMKMAKSFTSRQSLI